MVNTDRNGWVPTCAIQSDQFGFHNKCKRLLLEDVMCKSNTAMKAGGAIFTPDMQNMYISSNAAEEQPMQLALLSPDMLVHYGLSENYVEQGGYGDEIASDFASLALLSDAVISKNHASGSSLSRVEIEVLDWHKQRITSDIPSSSKIDIES